MLLVILMVGLVLSDDAYGCANDYVTIVVMGVVIQWL